MTHSPRWGDTGLLGPGEGLAPQGLRKVDEPSPTPIRVRRRFHLSGELVL